MVVTTSFLLFTSLLADPRLDPVLIKKYRQFKKAVYPCKLIISSAFRTPEHNKKVGGVPNSYHLKGKALDIVSNCPYKRLGDVAIKYFYGVLVYVDHIHVDVRKRKYRWLDPLYFKASLIFSTISSSTLLDDFLANFSNNKIIKDFTKLSVNKEERIDSKICFNSCICYPLKVRYNPTIIDMGIRVAIK